MSTQVFLLWGEKKKALSQHFMFPPHFQKVSRFSDPPPASSSPLEIEKWGTGGRDAETVSSHKIFFVEAVVLLRNPASFRRLSVDFSQLVPPPR